MISVDIAPAQAILKNVAETIQKAPGLMTTAADRRYRKVRPLIKKDAHTSASVHSGKMIWSFNPDAQLRALRWWFANRVPKGSRGGRYKRTGATDKATEVTGSFTKTGGVISLENDAKGNEFVFGFKQVPSFQGLHPKFEEVAEKWGLLLTDQLSEDWLTVADPFGGVPQGK